MNAKAIAVITVLLLGMSFAISYVSYKLGEERTVARYNAEVAKLMDEHAVELKKHQEAANAIASKFHRVTYEQAGKSQALQRQLRSRPTVEQCSKTVDGSYVAFIAPFAVRVLDEASRVSALPDTSDRQVNNAAGRKVTVNQLVQYTEYAISQYNRCGIQANALSQTLSDIIDRNKQP